MLAENIIQMGYMNIVITGGEPTLQYNEVFQLVTAIKSHYIKTKGRPVATISCPECQVEERLPTFYIETNGSIATIDMVLSSPVDHWIISPKDPVSADYWVRTLKNAPGPVHGKVMLKFVVKTPKDLPEELGDMVFFVQPMILPGQDPLQEYAGLVKDVLANMKTFPNIVILPQLHKLIGVK
jgi:organic radical activating enzyme